MTSETLPSSSPPKSPRQGRSRCSRSARRCGETSPPRCRTRRSASTRSNSGCARRTISAKVWRRPRSGASRASPRHRTSEGAFRMTTHAPAGIDLERLATWAGTDLPQFRPPFTAEQIAGGRSNITVKLTDAEGRPSIIRRPPLHTTLATAHDVGREYRVIHALGPTPVPVPEAYAHCVDESVIGAPFYVMEYVDGIVLHDFGGAERLDEAARHRVNLSVVDAQVALHAVDIDAVGLGDLAKREDYIGRQLRRWYRQYEAQKTDDLPGLDTMYALLTEKMPEQRDTAIVHGDLRSGNCMIDTNGEVLAVLDW